jgi:hypothetical protein
MQHDAFVSCTTRAGDPDEHPRHPDRSARSRAQRRLRRSQLRRSHSEQRGPRVRPPVAARAGSLAPQLPGLVEGHGPRRLPERRRVPAHRGRRGPGRLGQVRLREDARLPLGHPAGAEGRRPHHPLRPPQGRAGLAGGAGRIPVAAAPADRDPGRHRTGLGGAAALAGPDRAVLVRHAQPVPGERGRRSPPVGHGLPAGQALRQGRARGSPGPAGTPQRPAGQPAHPGRLQRTHARLAVVLHVHLLHRP